MRDRDVGEAQLAVLLEAALHDVANVRGNVGGERGPLGLFHHHRGERHRDVLGVERAPAREHFEQHAAEGPDVGALVDGLAARLLGAHVGGGAENDADARGRERQGGGVDRVDRAVRSPRVERFRQTEVEHLHGAIGPHLHVGRFQIAMDDAFLVRGGEGLGDLVRDGERFVEWEGTSLDRLGTA